MDLAEFDALAATLRQRSAVAEAQHAREFPVADGRCHDQVWFHFHDAGDDELIAPDFLTFVASKGISP